MLSNSSYSASTRVIYSSPNGLSLSPSPDAFASREGPYTGAESPINRGLPKRTTNCTSGSGGIHAGDANGGWCGFTGASNTSSVRNLDVNRVGAVMVMVIVVVERIKRSRREEVDRSKLKRAVDKSKRP